MQEDTGRHVIVFISDLYCVLEVDHYGQFVRKAKTKICKTTGDPVWNQVKTLPFPKSIISHPILSCILSLLTHHIQSYSISSHMPYSISFHPILSHPILFYPIVSFSIYPFPSHRILSYDQFSILLFSFNFFLPFFSVVLFPFLFL